MGSLPCTSRYVHFIVSRRVLSDVNRVTRALVFLVKTVVAMRLISSRKKFVFVAGHVAAGDGQGLLFIVTAVAFFVSTILSGLAASVIVIVLVQGLVNGCGRH